MSCTPIRDGTQPAQGRFCLTSLFIYLCMKKLEVRIVSWIFMYMYNAMGTSCTSRVPEYFRAGCIPIRTRSASRSRHTSSFAVTGANSLPIYLTHQQICLFSLCDCCLMLWNYWTFFWVIVERSHVSINFKPLKSTFLLLHLYACTCRIHQPAWQAFEREGKGN